MILELKNIVRAIFFCSLAVILMAQVGMAFYAWSLFRENLAPELEHKTEAIALSLGDKLSKALKMGIPFDALEGTEDYFSEVLQRNPDVAFIALASPEGKVAHSAGHSAGKINQALAAAIRRPSSLQPSISWADLPEREQPEISQIVSVRLREAEGPSSVLHVGVNRGFLDAKVSEIKIDILVVLIISLMIVFESMRFIMSTHLLAPLAEVEDQVRRIMRGDYSTLIVGRGFLERIVVHLNNYVLSVHVAATELVRRAGSRGNELFALFNERFVVSVSKPVERAFHPVAQVRLITFLFMFGEQLSRPFLPVFARGLLPEGTSGANVLAGLPISAFMLAVALSMPALTTWSDRVGRLQSFSWGVLASTGGLVGATFCFGISDFILWRVVTAIGYALMFVSCQGFVIDNTDEKDRSQGVATFVGAIMVSELCAPGIGGILADRLGERSVFAIGAGVMLLAALVASSVLSTRTVPDRRKAPRSSRLTFGAIRNPRYIALLLTAAIPAKFALTAFMFYIVPVGLASLDASKAEIGRVAMLYAIPSVLAASLFARLSDRLGWGGLMVGLGGMLSGAGFLPVLFWPNETAMVVGVLALGLGHSMSISPQLALVTEMTREEIAQYGAGSVLGIFRLVERGGAALGPVVAGALAAQIGPLEAAGVLGVISFVSGVAFSVIFLVFGIRPEIGLFSPQLARTENAK